MKHAKKLSLFSLSLLSSLVLSAHAAPNHYTIVAPTCLLENPYATFHTLTSTGALSLIETDSNGLEALIQAKHARRQTPCGGFIDVTETIKAYQGKTTLSKKSATQFLKQYLPKPARDAKTVSYGINHEAEVNQLIKALNPDAMWSDLAAFTNTSKDQFPDRFANSTTGVKAAEWLKAKIEALAQANGRSDITAYTVATGTSYKQPSVVVKIGDSNEAGIVIGGHMDTLSSSRELKPGADDDGSGSMTVMGIARTLISSGMHFKKPIYIIWYSAEEMGLVGSSWVVKDFKNKHIAVDAALQFDMTG
jgi:bacterial leucyl aminopeptidase